MVLLPKKTEAQIGRTTTCVHVRCGDGSSTRLNDLDVAAHAAVLTDGHPDMARTLKHPGEPSPVTALASAELLRRARTGESQALSQLFARYMPQLHRWAHRRVPAWARRGIDTGDLVQETVLRTIPNLRAFEPQREGALLRYLRRTLLNRVRDQMRYAARHPAPCEITDGLVDSDASPLELTVNREDHRRYRAALARLRAADRSAIVARIELGYTYEQLALTLRKSTPEAARLAVRRALLRLGDEMRRA
jgi:RNA polymerase sigma factor (sigma-70 family)